MDDVCPQTPPISPTSPSGLLEELEAEFKTGEFRSHAYGSLSGAIQIPTEMYDDMGIPGEDPKWNIFAEMHAYLESRFPLVHAKLTKVTPNTYALVYHWQGSDDSRKPILLTAHQDVVPVEPSTADQWIQPPFSGYYDGEWIWGRGSCDDKPGLISTLTTVETLLSKGFQPVRSIVLAYGMDEERGGRAGATAIRDYLLEHYGEDAFSIIVDEGGGYIVRGDALMSTPAVAEKGKLDARLEISTPGGHSSIPPRHTSIGMLAALIKHIEANPHVPHLNRTSTYYTQLHCQAEHDPLFPPNLKRLVKNSLHCDKALAKLEKELLKSNPMFGPLSGTTQAVDIIHGGVKSNALPENAYFIMNHRIDVLSSVDTVKYHIADTVGPVANSFNLSVDAFGAQYGDLSKEAAFGHLQLSDAYGTQLEPAPVTPTFGSGPYELLAGTIISALSTSNRTDIPKKVFLTPSLSTDTRHYWKLSKHIFRYGHVGREDHYNGAHTVNEACRAEGFLEVIRFHTRLILNGHDSPLLE
ncbi:carboxypeptidase S [Daedalea quercina L-15889]|uniref:Carboxypeptidase S n=1 Tax=Daedalea quercina L-15889 TaxID=1314783 RepID=A0A165MKI5_9APHY|nr:carboxypeptidase S [Daedalea quercina L-15889]